jgi:hypothetical protein
MGAHLLAAEAATEAAVAGRKSATPQRAAVMRREAAGYDSSARTQSPRRSEPRPPAPI